jgi:alpha-mannosidase
VVHRGDWSAGGVMAESRRFAAPPIAVNPSGKHTAPAGRALVEVAPEQVVLASVHPAETGRGTVVRVVNCGASAREASLRVGFPVREAIAVDPVERQVDLRLEWSDGVCRVQLGPWQIATVLFRT